VKRAALVLLLAIPLAAGAQTARVAGQVLDERQGPVQGATVRLTGGASQVTSAGGRFLFEQVVPGRYLLTVAAIGHQLQTLQVTIAGDTSLAILLPRRTITLDTVRVLPGRIRIRGTAVDSASGDKLMQAQATLYPDGKFVGAMTGTFIFDSIAPGPVTIMIEGAEHLPARVDFVATRDTSFQVRLSVDSVALRMIAQQVVRLTKRSQAVPYTVRGYNRDIITEQRTMTIGEFIDHKLSRSWSPAQRALLTAMSSCVFIDDRKVEPALLDGTIPELVERVELYGNGRMIRVYTKRYVASLIGQDGLGQMMYMPTGLQGTCR
jgi:protocatechuate 3,4-dioxygenase beta subunit